LTNLFSFRDNIGRGFLASGPFGTESAKGRIPMNDNVNPEDEQNSPRQDGSVPASDKEVWLALAAARMGIWQWDLNSDAVKWSTATVHAHGLTPETVPTSGRAAFELVHPDDRQHHQEACNRAIREGADLFAEYRIVGADAVHWVQSRGHVTYDAAGKPCRMLGVNLEISDRKLLEEKVLQANVEAERLRILKATMRTVQDIVNNALMSLYEFRGEAEPHVSPQSLERFDRIIAETAAKLRTLGDLEHVTETQMEMGTGIDYQSRQSSEKP
jgi:PAS domain S-box-containing protein